MSLLDIWSDNPASLQDKTVRQIIAFAGNGRLTDDGETSAEFRGFLATISAELLGRYAEECLESFPESGIVLQDVINEIGRRLGFKVTNGRYRGHKGVIGNDGLWNMPDGTSIVVEVKTTDAYRIDLNTIARYSRDLSAKGVTNEERTSVLIVVGRSDTGDLEAQVRGSKFAWEMRLISVDALIRLMMLKQSLDDPTTLKRIHQILLPREFTKLDEIVDLVFSTAEDAKATEEEIPTPPLEATAAGEPDTGPPEAKGPKFTPVAFNSEVAARIASAKGIALLKRTRASFSTPDDETVIVCSVSKEHKDPRPNYWFGFHPHQRELLEESKHGYVAFGCGSPELIFLIPIGDMAPWFEGMNVTENDERFYWHIQIAEEGGKHVLVRRQGQPRIDLTPYRLQ